MKTAVIVPAGGAGTRMGGDVPKQYLMLGGIPIIVRSLLVFQEAPLVDDIFLVLPGGDVASAPQRLLSGYNLTKVKKVLSGGAHRQDSVKNAINALGADYDIVVVHDGVRPFVSQEIVRTAIEEAGSAQAVTVGVPVKDTIKLVNDAGLIEETVNRDRLWCTQTPQAFAATLLKKAYAAAYAQHYYATDDAGLVERLGTKVKMLMGSYDNIKITTAGDLAWGEFLLQKRHNK